MHPLFIPTKRGNRWQRLYHNRLQHLERWVIIVGAPILPLIAALTAN